MDNIIKNIKKLRLTPAEKYLINIFNHSELENNSDHIKIRYKSDLIITIYDNQCLINPLIWYKLTIEWSIKQPEQDLIYKKLIKQYFDINIKDIFFVSDTII